MINKSVFNERVVNECCLCGIIAPTHTHHISYKKNITIELCYKCHRKVHMTTNLYHPLDARPMHIKIELNKKMWHVWGQFIRFELENEKKPILDVLEPKNKPKLSIWGRKKK